MTFNQGKPVRVKINLVTFHRVNPSQSRAAHIGRRLAHSLLSVWQALIALEEPGDTDD
jgi:hypothetical protein